MTVLTREEILELIEKEEMIQNYIDLELQLNDHGFDITVDKIYKLVGYSVIDFTNELRTLPRYEELSFEKTRIRDKEVEAVVLEPGCYVVEINEIVKLPRNICAVVLPRSSLIRSGIALHSALWDAGYHGKGRLMLSVHNSAIITENARIGQMMFLTLNAEVEGYKGSYQLEGVNR